MHTTPAQQQPTTTKTVAPTSSYLDVPVEQVNPNSPRISPIPQAFPTSIPIAKRSVVSIIYSINSIKDISKQLLALPKGSWVFLDLDDMLIVPTSPLLRTTNSTAYSKLLDELKTTYPNLKDLVWLLNDHCNNILVEPEFKDLIEKLKAKGIHVIGLTARRTNYPTQIQKDKNLSAQDLTLSQLKKLGIFFSSILSTLDGKLIDQGTTPQIDTPKDDLFTFLEKGPAIFKNGVAFTSHQCKGKIFKILLEKAKEAGIPLPPAMALLDDKPKNLLDVDKNLLDVDKNLKNSCLNIPFHCIHYQGAVKKLDNTFNPKVTKLQLATLAKGQPHIPYDKAKEAVSTQIL